MHKLMHKGLKKKKKSKKGKKGAEEEEFDPEELERYRRERAEALEKAAAEGSTAAAGSDEWQKFQALTAGVDSILKKTQGDLDRIKSTSFFQRKAPVVEEKKPEVDPELEKERAKRFIGFDKDGNPIEQVADKEEGKKKELTVTEKGFVEIPDDDDEDEISGDEDIFDTTYIDVLQNTEIQLAYIPDSPTEEEAGDDPFDTTNADKVLKTVDKHGKKVVSLGNAVEVLSGRVDQASACKISRPRKVRVQNLLLDDAEVSEPVPSDAGEPGEIVSEPIQVERTLLDDDSDLPDIPIDLTNLPSILPRPVTPEVNAGEGDKLLEGPIDISEFEVLKEKTILEEIPDLDDDFDLDGPVEAPASLIEADDPFAEKEPEAIHVEAEIIEASFEVATFVNEEDPFDTTFADNLVPGKTELRFIEKELEDLPESEVTISLTDPSGLHRDYETGLLSKRTNKSLAATTDLLGGSSTDLTQLTEQPIAPAEEFTYADPFDTSGIQEPAPGHVELKFLEKELLGDKNKSVDSLDDDDFDPRKEETVVKKPAAGPPPRPPAFHPQVSNVKVSAVNFESEEVAAVAANQIRKPSRPEILGLAPVKSVSFELPTPSQRPDLLITSDEEKSIHSKPLTPYYTQKSIDEIAHEEILPDEEGNVDLDPFDTSFVAKVTPGKTELKLIESELLQKQETKLTHSTSEHDFNPREAGKVSAGRRQSDFGGTSVRPKSLKFGQVTESLLEDGTEVKSVYEINEAAHRKKPDQPKRQESLLDAEVDVNTKALTPTIESKVSEEDEEEISYVDPFDTSIASNILPGKAELKLLESELSKIPNQVQQIKINPISADKLSRAPQSATLVTEDDDFDPRAGEVKVSQDFLSSDVQESGDKVLTPVLSEDFEDESIDPFDTSFASIGPGKTELRLLESELVDKKMDSKGGNPFLMDDYPSEPVSQQSNPFLQDFAAESAEPAPAPTVGSDNPFFNFTAEQSYQPPQADSTNPFAFFEAPATEVQPQEEFIPATTAADVQEANLLGTDTQINLFTDQVQPDYQPQEPAAVDFSSPPNEKVKVEPSNEKPTPKRPPPPPRPGPPPAPPRNTKDLILSVTDAMDATSNHLLDRLQATRTPSPTLMHSPSPTPEHSYADFLDVDNNIPDLMPDDTQPTNGNQTENILDIFDGPSAEITAASIFSAPSMGIDTSISQPATDISTFTTTNANLMAENPFGEVNEPSVVDVDVSYGSEAAVPEDTLAEKRQSIDVATPFTDMTTEDPTTVPVSSEIDESQSNFFSVGQSTVSDMTSAPFSSTQSGLFGTEPLFTTASTAETTQVPTSTSTNIFTSDLLGGFGQPADTVEELTSSSPTPASEFPVIAYKPEELDSFAAATEPIQNNSDAFDAFASKFDKAAEPEAGVDPFMDAFGSGQTAMDTSSDVWGDSSAAGSEGAAIGFGESEGFDSFLSMTAPPQEAGARMKRNDSADSDEAPDFSVFIKPKEGTEAFTEGGPVPVLAPPPKSPMNSAFTDTSPRFNPFDKSAGFAQEAVVPSEMPQVPEMTRTDSQETPPTPLFDEDVSQPLEDFPRVTYTGDGWEMHLRQPNKKKITGQRFWKKIFVRLVYQGDAPVLQLFNKSDDKDPFQELPLLTCYSVSDIAAQQFDQYGKIFTVKLQYIFYKERPGVRPGQVTKAERLTNKLSQFAAYAIQGDYQGVKEFGSDLKKLGLPVEHAPQISQLFKLGSLNYEDLKMFSCAIEEALFRIPAQRDRALTYKMEEVQINVVDELYVEQSAAGHVDKQIARVRLFFLGFLTGMPDVELGINDMWRQGKEVVGRHDIIPVVTEEWIRLESVEFHSCVQPDEYEKSRIIKFKPPDACYIELMRFRVRPPKNRELPLQLKAVMCVTGNKVELRADILVPGFASRKLGQIPCEDVMVRFPIPECWIYLFRVEKHFRYGSVKSAHRRTGKIKGIERFLGAVDTLEPQLMEVTSGQAKYEHQHRAIVWRMPRLPKEGQGAYTTHGLVCRMCLTSYDQIPEKLAEYAYVEFTMPATQVSHTTARSVSLQNSDSDNPPEKYVRNLSRHEYRVGIEHTQGEGPGAYVSATKKIPESTPETHEEPVHPAAAESDSDSSE
ncbi:protein stoned-B-like [Microplitis mediator]|uniref:protein stoned-B-like n=1 Tax=Microplitis mediator TaxID=375433 RepID=UPI002554BE35|nr:protein stoned-B-like [Microplitis mediator]